ncbi:MAG TPA: translation initiation factor IF-5A [Candidatus Methanofastidiosa archaeon]|nr:translation initiation factor IF-5A [Candidatus Methanofastidiosa archaeon]HPR42243.1 translation initiation factor IF-5A [Candidatus Methanofastidiosa archaeon]
MGTTKPERVGQLKVGRYIVIDDEPCKIIAYSTSSPGKHGAAKARIDAKGIFDGQKRSIIKPVDAKVQIPIIDKASAMVTAIMGETAQIMDMNSYEYFDLTINDDIEGDLGEGVQVEYMETMGRMKILRVKGS